MLVTDLLKIIWINPSTEITGLGIYRDVKL